jgi:tRNA(Ile)-lysidine synthase
MLNGLLSMVRRYEMLTPGDRVYCAVSGGADSVAMLFAFYLLKEKLDIRLCAAHFNHGLRGEESDRDEAFVRGFCHQFDIPLFVGRGEVTPGKKGLEAAAREARYSYFATLDGIIATAHTADDNAETVLLHLVRGTGLKGLGGITPKRDNLIRPMLTVTRAEVLAFLEEYHLSYVTDSSNDTDAFLRNRLRHHVMPLLKRENPRVAENLSQMAMQLRCDEEVIGSLAGETLPPISALREMPQPVRSRALERFLKENGIREPERRHILLVEELVYSANPSAKADLPGGISVSRCYDTLTVLQREEKWQEKEIACPGVTELPELGIRVVCRQAQQILQEENIFTVQTVGKMLLRPKTAGDVITLPGGTKSLKKLFIDKKIPAHRRSQIPVLADDAGLLAVYGIGADQKRMAKALPAWQVTFQKIEK